MASSIKEAKLKDKKTKKTDKNRHEPEPDDDANRLSSKYTTPVVSAEKSGGKKRKGESVELAIRKKPANPFLPKSGDSDDPDISGERSEGQDNDSSEESNSGKKKDDGYADPDFNGRDYGLPVHATRSDLDELLKQGRGYDALAEQLRLLQAENQSKSSTSNQTVIVSDMNTYHITSERINAVGFTKLREKCEAEKRNGRTIYRNLLITADAQKLIGQMLGAKKVPDFANWKAWTDLQFFESLSKICPAGLSRTAIKPEAGEVSSHSSQVHSCATVAEAPATSTMSARRASKLACALSDAGKRLAAAGKTHIVNDKGDAGGKKPWNKKKGANLIHDLPFLAALRAPESEYLISGLLRGASTDNTNTHTHTDPLPVHVLLDTGAVVDNYCSKAV
ncbi:hypothetical protein B484DRAFT_473543, partial [Ochromonadaceae sp. CCMP2298]